ncbi:MAG TPA: S9 family peptidase, partial [Bacteroidia bacterium]|nr:S9 family peptidase [Bacteroidia bacterium]
MNLAIRKNVFFISLLTIAFTSAQAQKKDITLKDIWQKPTFYPEYVYGLRSMNDGSHYTSLDYSTKDVAIVKYDYATGKPIETVVKESQLIPKDSTKAIHIDSYQFSEDEKKILIATATEHIYRHSTRETYYVWDIAQKKLSLLSTGAKQMFAQFSPDGNEVAFMRDNNLYIKNLTTDLETQVTTDGLFNNIINGGTDWVYEEEFGFARAFYWSPDSKKIAFYRFDESKVKEFSMNEYKNQLYPSEYKFKYPKAGETNSQVSIRVYDVASKKTLNVDIGAVQDTDQYIPRVQWTMDPNTLSIVRMNRLQNKLELLFADASTGKSKVIYTETSKTYVDVNEEGNTYCTFLKDKKHFILLSEKDGYNHIYLYNIDGTLVRQITHGNWDVLAFKGINENTNTLYYTSSEVSPTDIELYSIKLDGSDKKLLSPIGTNDAEFSSNFKYYINDYSTANTPPFITLNNDKGKEIRVLESNEALKDTLADYALSKKQFFTLKDSAGVILNAWMIKPIDFDSTKKYPVLMNVYGGPGINTVNNEWGGPDYLWHEMLAEKGYIIVSVDNRGTGGRGKAFKDCTYKELGKYETQDQIDAAKYLGTLAYVDKTRIGIWGWSYGGYMSSLCITKGADYFKTAIAVAPVTNWRYYDSVYTERYMQTPEENPDGYDKNSPINFVDKLRGHYLLIHGTADDNVHFQNTIEMIAALVNANKQFELAIYPDKNHGIYGGNTRLHLYTK